MSAAARKARMVCAIAAGVVAVSAFLPWASFLGYTKYGIDGDGQVTLVLAVAGLLLAWRRWLGWFGQLVPAGLVTVFGLYDVTDAGSLAAIGLYLTFLAGGGWVVGAFMMRAASAVGPESPSTEAPESGAPPSEAEPPEPAAIPGSEA